MHGLQLNEIPLNFICWVAFNPTKDQTFSIFTPTRFQFFAFLQLMFNPQRDPKIPCTIKTVAAKKILKSL